jgi:hypothetical protein
LCTDDEEVIFDFVRPVVVNGIDEVATRPDLADRCLLVRLPAIPPARRRREKDILEAFAQAAPRIYGAVLSAVAGALAREPTTVLPVLPRMADFAVFATAAERALGWPAGAFVSAYTANRSDTTSSALDADLVAQLAVRFMSERREWCGTARELLDELRAHSTEQERQSRAWPGAPHVLSARLRRAAPMLRELGVDVDADALQGRDRERRRVLTLRKVGDRTDPGDPGPHSPGIAEDFPDPAGDPAGSLERPGSARDRSDSPARSGPISAVETTGIAGIAPTHNCSVDDAPFAEWVDSEVRR